jgi:3'-phosphoadenosine 5'-phosphosulfate sulfotransferase (PAPS reductase)/FAD synthetase
MDWYTLPYYLHLDCDHHTQASIPYWRRMKLRYPFELKRDLARPSPARTP